MPYIKPSGHFAPLNLVEEAFETLKSLEPFKLALMNFAFAKLASLISAAITEAPDKLALVKLAVPSPALDRFARVRFAPVKFALVRWAPAVIYHFLSLLVLRQLQVI